MSHINFILRKKEGVQTIYFRFRPSKQFDLLHATPYSIDTPNWDSGQQRWNEDHVVFGAKTAESKLRNSDIKEFNRKLSDFRSKVERFIGDNLDVPAVELKSKIKAFVHDNFFGHRISQPKVVQSKYTIPELFFDLVDYYIEYRSVADATKNVEPIAENTIKKYRTLQRFIASFDSKLSVTDINDVFRNNLVKFMSKLAYSEQTQVKYIKDIKMLCVFANKELPISKQVLNWEINANPSNVSEYKALSFSDMEKLKNADVSERLDHTRDWFIISCYTSARVSELAQMTSAKVEKHGEDYFIEVVEDKNKRRSRSDGKKIIYLMPQVIEILNKRGGEFPKRVSKPTYNKNLKELFEAAEFTEEVEYGVTVTKEKRKRKVLMRVPFFKAMSSHSGRATYVTLFSDKLPAEIIQLQTNHQSTEMVDHYNKTDYREKMLRKAKLVADAHRSIESNYKPVELKVIYN